MSHKNCPVKFHSILVFGTLRELHRVLNRMNIAVHHCPDCVKREDCPLMASFKGELSNALHEIYTEWDLK